jgi:hypothetical protein
LKVIQPAFSEMAPSNVLITHRVVVPERRRLVLFEVDHFGLERRSDEYCHGNIRKPR